jgi:hypothetical protein
MEVVPLPGRANADWWQIVVSTFSSPPGLSPNWMLSSTAHAIHRSGVTRETAANRIPVARQTTSRMLRTAGIRAMAATSASKVSTITLLAPLLEEIGTTGPVALSCPIVLPRLTWRVSAHREPDAPCVFSW